MADGHACTGGLYLCQHVGAFVGGGIYKYQKPAAINIEDFLCCYFSYSINNHDLHI